jgi:hypothetical protein
VRMTKRKKELLRLYQRERARGFQAQWALSNARTLLEWVNRLSAGVLGYSTAVADVGTESRADAMRSISSQETTWQPALTVPSGSMRSMAYGPR